MEFAALLAILKAVGDVAGAINNIYGLVKNVQEFFNDPSDVNQERYLSTYSAIIDSREVVLAASAEILTAVATVDKHVFESIVADKLGDVDEAIQDIEAWHRSKSDPLRDLALDRSAGALADVLQLEANGVYPKTALVFALIQITASRLGILREADSGFGKSGISRKPIETAISTIRSTADDLESGIRAANVIHKSLYHHVRVNPRDHSRSHTWTFDISYSNISGTSAFSRKVGPSDDPLDTRTPAEAQAAQSKGILEDIDLFKVPLMRDSAARFEQMLLASELETISSVTRLPVSRLTRSRYALLRGRRDVGGSIELLFRDMLDGNEPVVKLDIAEMARQLNHSESVKSDRELLDAILRRFGTLAVLQIWLSQSQ